MGEWYLTFFQRLGNPRKVNSAVDWFKRFQFILFDSITSSESEMLHVDGFHFI